MRVEGAILPIGSPPFTHGGWCELVARRLEFRLCASRQVKNLFTGGSIGVQPRPDTAEVVVGTEVVGHVYWSMSEEPLVNISIDPSALYLVHEWARELGGAFKPDLPGPSA